jgi:hypothetical protein
MVVQLTAGVFNITGSGLIFRTNNCTLRGAGPGQGLNTGINSVEAFPGTFVVDSTATQLIKADRATNPSRGVLYMGYDAGQFVTSVNFAADAAQGATSVILASNPGLRVGQIVYLDEVTNNDPDVFWGPEHDPAGGGSRRWFIRQDRSITQTVEIVAINGNTVTFATPLHHSFKVSEQAQLSTYQNVGQGIGVEDIFFFGGMGGDYNGNVSMNLCAYCWIKHIEAAYAQGTGVGMYGSYRSELRDSYIHETPSPDPGGNGYLTGMVYGASDNLFENNIMWSGNKEIVMRATGGGNVVAYNYMDDSFGAGYPNSSEAGLNAGHYTTPHMELLEGNYSQNYKGDSYWGNSIDITVFRNWLSALRAAHPPLNAYKNNNGGCLIPYMDLDDRIAVDVQAYSYRTNFVGNVLGMSNQQLLNYSSSCYTDGQTGFTVQQFTGFPSGNPLIMWQMGSDQSHQAINGNWGWVANTYQTQLMDGNWDWVTKAQHWYGIGGPDGTDNPQPIPNSLYLTNAPPFFGSNTWPWVNPSTGTTYVLPAKARFDAGTPNKL